MEADRLKARREENSFRNDQRDKRHHAEVSVEGFDLIEDRLTLERSRLAERQARRERLRFEWIGAAAGRVRRAKNVDDPVAAGVQDFERLLGEGSLPNQHNAQNQYLDGELRAETLANQPRKCTNAGAQ